MLTRAFVKAFVICVSVALLPNTSGAQVHFDSCLSNTGSNATIIVDVDGGNHSVVNEPFESGDELAFFSEDGTCVGMKPWTGQNFALALWGDNPATSEKDGLYPNETIEVRVWRETSATEYGGGHGTVTLGYLESPPFISGGSFVQDGLYDLVEINVEQSSPGGRNRVSAKSAKGNAKERGKDKTGAFKISRVGSLEFDVQVFYAVQGTAENGVDYALLDSAVVIRAGNSAAYVVIDPIEDSGVEGTETVALVLLEDDGYDLEMSSASAMLTIVDLATTVASEAWSEPETESTKFFDAYPNPFADGISVDYLASTNEDVTVGLYDAIGRSVAGGRKRTVVEGERYRFELSTHDLPVGVYFVRIMGRAGSITKTVTRIR
jgi:hypothetical protein